LDNVRNFKGLFPFRIGCTSYVFPDDIVPNVEKMGPLIDDVEIVLFESPSYGSNLPDSHVIQSLKQLQDAYGLSYTIHFPIDKKAGSNSKEEREELLDTIVKIKDLTNDIKPYGYLLHLEGLTFDATDEERMIWREHIDLFCCRIHEAFGGLSDRICIENLAYPPEWYDDIVKRYGFSFCIDVGHLWFYNQNWEEYVLRMLPTTKVIHLHGVTPERDHKSLRMHAYEQLSTLYDKYLRQYNEIVTLELFSKEDTFESLELLCQLNQKLP